MTARVLIVDDEVNHRRSLSISLRMEGFEVFTAADGQQALEMASTQAFEYAIMDLMMPRVDGLELARRLTFAYPATHIVLMSANHLTVEQLSRAGLPDVDFLPKPYELEDLLSKLASREERSGTVTLGSVPPSESAASA